jgi:PhnB protein
MRTINPYLTFDGNCEEAFEFYRSVFGGEFASIARFSEMPGENAPSEDESNKIMHVALPIGGSSILMGSDRPSSFGKGKQGDMFSVSLHPSTPEEAKELFDGLAAGGTVTMPLEKSFWGALFGMFTDKFGVHWMVNHELKAG